MKCQILFSGKNKKNNIILSSAENAQRVVKVNNAYVRVYRVNTVMLVVNVGGVFVFVCLFVCLLAFE